LGRQESVTSRRIVAISPDDGTAIDLANPAVAALLSWLVPGLGQFYQGRRLKGWLFMATLLTTFLAGTWLGNGRVVYASWKPGETRWAFVCQAGIGLAALPAMIQSWRLGGVAKEPLFGSGFMAPPLSRGQPVSPAYARKLILVDPDIQDDDFRPLPPWQLFRPLPPPGTLDRKPADQLAIWHARLGRFFEIGTLFTMLAGMLNVLVVYDAWSGPMRLAADKESDEKKNP
jgi:TM2 domain-containing membrane protein YozV